MDQGFATIVGRLSSAPKFFGEDNPDKQRALFSIAYNRRGGERRKANFIDCIAWGKRADIMREFGCGNGIMVTGDLEQDNYTNKDGVKVNRVQVNVSSITATKAIRNSNADAKKESAGEEVRVGGSDESEEIPF
jgi:single-strand DNA-binding protein